MPRSRERQGRATAKPKSGEARRASEWTADDGRDTTASRPSAGRQPEVSRDRPQTMLVPSRPLANSDVATDTQHTAAPPPTRDRNAFDSGWP
jgi:hypothetical protein